MKLFELNRDFLRKTVVLTLPVILQSLITIGINFMDNLMVGSFGETQIAAASFGNQFYGLFLFFIFIHNYIKSIIIINFIKVICGNFRKAFTIYRFITVITSSI